MKELQQPPIEKNQRITTIPAGAAITNSTFFDKNDNLSSMSAATSTTYSRRILSEEEDIRMVSDDEWNSILASMITREENLVGIYALHVSKSGGE